MSGRFMRKNRRLQSGVQSSVVKTAKSIRVQGCLSLRPPYDGEMCTWVKGHRTLGDIPERSYMFEWVIGFDSSLRVFRRCFVSADEDGFG